MWQTEGVLYKKLTLSDFSGADLWQEGQYLHYFHGIFFFHKERMKSKNRDFNLKPIVPVKVSFKGEMKTCLKAERDEIKSSQGRNGFDYR